MRVEERETIVSISYVPPGEVSVYSTQRVMWEKCRKAGWRLHAEEKDRNGRSIWQDWVAGPNDLRISPRRVGRANIKTGYALKARNGAETEGK